jgi:hypothetical protein
MSAIDEGQTPKEGTAKNRDRWLIAALCISGFILVSAALYLAPQTSSEGHQKYWEMGAHLLRDLGIALVVASALAFAVDEYLKEKLVSSVAREVSHHVAKNTSKYVFGYLVPDDLKEELLELMRPAALRRNFRLHLSLDYLGDKHPNFVRVTTKVSFILENLKDQELSYRHSLKMTSMFADMEAPEIVRFACRKGSRDEYKYDYRGTNSMLAANDERLTVSRSSDNRELIVRRIVTIPPFSKEFEFRTESSEIMEVPYADVLSFTYATSIVEVEAHYPKDMDVVIEFGKGRAVEIYTDHPSRPTIWRYTGVCLAGQHIKYDFRRRAELLPGTDSELADHSPS